jgi:membrane fusion protein, multidrug efflux system
MNDPTTPPTDKTIPPTGETTPPNPAEAPAKPSPKSNEWRKVAGQMISIAVVFGAVVLALWVWNITEQHPRTDDAVARANVVGVVARAPGQIIKLNVQDNQEVKAGDVLFEIDPDDYKIALEKAKADLATLDRQIEVARAQDADLKFQIKAAEAGVEQAQVEFDQASNTLHRLEPLLPKGFTTADDVDKARTAKQVAAASLAGAEQRLNQANTTISPLATLVAQRAGAVAAVDLATLKLSYCKVTAPFPGRVINLNISAGAYASPGIPVFSLLDTRNWYVIANFREGEIRHFAPGASVDVYLLSAPNRHFVGKVQGIGWSVVPEGAIDLPLGGVPYVKRELNWVHIAQRFPVRIEVENPDPDLFRMGASAVAIIKGPLRK